MGDIINFYEIKKYNIFEDDYLNLRSNNKIMFGDKDTHIAVLYAPNGTGKTSFVDVLDSDGTNSEIKYRCKYKKQQYTEKSSKKLFHIIRDHHGRNVIRVKETDYIIGENIQREYQLRDFLETKQKALCSDEINKILKEFGYTTKTNLQYNLFTNSVFKEICRKLISKNDREKCEFQDFYNLVMNLELDSVSGVDENKIKYVRENFTDKNSILYLISNIDKENIKTNDKIKRIGCNNDAISVMIKYPNEEKCIVCENHYTPSEMLEKKKKENEQIYGELSEESKKILQNIIEKVDENNDPFKIKSLLTSVLTDGKIDVLDSLNEEILLYVLENMKMAGNAVYELFKRNQLKEEYKKYDMLTKEEPEITEEDLLFVQEFVKSAIDKEIKLERISGKIKLTLDDKELYESDYDSLHLSTGEQNFISLSFEFLKARNREEEIIVLDDPISSFDSIFKNKIAFSIISVSS